MQLEDILIGGLRMKRSEAEKLILEILWEYQQNIEESYPEKYTPVEKNILDSLEAIGMLPPLNKKLLIKEDGKPQPLPEQAYNQWKPEDDIN